MCNAKMPDPTPATAAPPPPPIDMAKTLQPARIRAQRAKPTADVLSGLRIPLIPLPSSGGQS